MKPQFQPWHLLLLILAGWINRRQQDAVEYLLTENRVLREKLGKKRILLNDDQRRRLAVLRKILGRNTLEQLATIVTPDTILRWHRELVARHWDYSDRRKAAGRAPVTPEIVELVLLTPGPMPRQRTRCLQVTILVPATTRRTGHWGTCRMCWDSHSPTFRPRFLPFPSSNRSCVAQQRVGRVSSPHGKGFMRPSRRKNSVGLLIRAVNAGAGMCQCDISPCSGFHL